MPFNIWSHVYKPWHICVGSCHESMAQLERKLDFLWCGMCTPPTLGMGLVLPRDLLDAIFYVLLEALLWICLVWFHAWLWHRQKEMLGVICVFLALYDASLVDGCGSSYNMYPHLSIPHEVILERGETLTLRSARLECPFNPPLVLCPQDIIPVVLDY